MSNITNEQEKTDCLSNALAELMEEVFIDSLSQAFNENKYNGVTLGMIVQYREQKQCKSLEEVALLVINKLTPAPSAKIREYAIDRLNEAVANVGKTFDTLTLDDVKAQEKAGVICEE